MLAFAHRTPVVGRIGRRACRCPGARTLLTAALAGSMSSSAAPGEPLPRQASTPCGMDAQLEALVRSIHAAQQQAVIYTTGGAAQGTSWVLAVPGASSTVLEAVVPYSRASLVQLLGQEPAQYCSADTAVALARAAFQRAATLSSFGAPVVGLAATAALASEPPKRGEHRVWVAATTCGGTHLRSLRLAKGRRSRQGEEEVAGRLLAQVLAHACGLDAAADALPLCLLPPAGAQPGDELGPLQHSPVLPGGGCDAEDPLCALVAGSVRCVEYSGGRVFVDAPRGGPGRVYLPGSFNPLHDGHRAMLAAAVALAGPHAEGCFELTVLNADKGALDVGDIRRRVAQFVGAGLPVLVTTARLLVDKAHLLPGSTFVVGWDTAARIVLPKYYGDSDAAMALVLADIAAQGCHFLVAGRRDDKGDGSFRTLADIALPPRCPPGLFCEIPEVAFRADVSSTALRAAGKGLR